MSETIFSAGLSRRVKTDIAISLGLTAAIVFFVVSGAVSYLNTHTLREDARQFAHSQEVMFALDDLLSQAKDAETGQRGFLITGDEKYLAPYTAALEHVDDRLNALALLVQDNPDQVRRIPIIKTHLQAKLSELAETIQLRRTQGFGAALAVVVTDRGKHEMDAIRAEINAMQQTEIDLKNQRLLEMDGAYSIAVGSVILTGIAGVALAVLIALLMRRAAIARQRQEWLQSGQVGLSNIMTGEQILDKLGENILAFLARYLGAQAGVFYVRRGSGFDRIATYGVAATDPTPARFEPGDGMLGQAAKEAKAFLVNDVPEGYLKISSALGDSKPRHILIAPAIMDGMVNAVFELGFLQPAGERSTELVEQLSSSIGVAVRSAAYRADLQNLLEETQRQAEELQVQSEELRVSNEELEEQSRALKASQSNLEQQQVELEQTNAQLEQQAQLLEAQRDDLERANQNVEAKAREVEQASRYKSDFLANMSHELRTPLNSSLILAKLLSDNPEGNLSEEQVKFARTIQSSGQDLLTLINDILDLSKIEAGHMEIRSETVSLNRLVSDISSVFQPMAENRGLSFSTVLAPDCPRSIVTDGQRVSQILKNLLSNAIKFTEKGKVELAIRPVAGGGVAFDVSDTGIGISPDQQQLIFEAFRQADSAISRKYGGTGLGLSICREFTRLLGGSVALKSEPGKGSTFTVILPEFYNAAEVKPRSQPIMTPRPTPVPLPPIAAAHQKAAPLDDDRENLSGSSRIMLIIEDDETFAALLCDLARELKFQCLLAHTAEDGLILARQYLPSAVVLDVGLPDHSGLLVLDRLKHDPRTRHIPVHVVSGGDFTETAFSLGAVGYMVKPVMRDDLAEAFQQLETRLAKRMRRVLIVEDDAVQRDSVGKLLASQDVATEGVGTAAECLERLKETTFDCMVLDLSLPDASGYSLLETLSREDAYSFPPVIVYTGRDISSDEEQRLRRYSKSIIIKGAKSPERLLDEVTLFLHQVVSELPPEQQRMLEKARNRDAMLEGRHVLVVEDDIRNVYALTSILEPHGVKIQIARNGREALDILNKADGEKPFDLVLMDVMMPEMDGLTATREIRRRAEWKKLPIIMLTAKAMKDDQERCLEAGANDYMAKPLDVEKLLSLVRVWMPR